MGTDSADRYLREILRWLQKVPALQRPVKSDTMYGSSSAMLRYSMRSVQKHAKWARRIHIVAPTGQRPKWLANSRKVRSYGGHCHFAVACGCDVYVWEMDRDKAVRVRCTTQCLVPTLANEYKRKRPGAGVCVGSRSNLPQVAP